MSRPTSVKLYKRSNGIYYLIIEIDGQKEYRSTQATRKSDALRTLTQCKRLFEKKPPQRLLSTFIDNFLPFAEGSYSKGTVAIYRDTLEKFMGVTGNLLLTAITPQHIDNYKIERLKTISPVTVNIELRTLRAAMNVALRWKLLESNPFSRLQLAIAPESQPAFFTMEDFQRLLSIIREDWLKEIVVIAVLTGMRRGELVNLRWANVDLQRKLITIESSPTFRTKQGKRRTIPLSDVAFQLLTVRHQRTTQEYVYTINGKKLTEGWLSHKFKYYVYEARLKDDRLHFHSLRHTFASWLVQDGVSLYEVQKLLGHSNIAVTQVYSHLLPEGLHATVNRINVTLN